MFCTSFSRKCINSIDRALLNESLLEEALSNPNINALFRHKIVSVDFDERSMVVHKIDTTEDIHVNFDLCVGTDGSYSVVRRQLMRVVRSAFSWLPLNCPHISHSLPCKFTEWTTTRSTFLTSTWNSGCYQGAIRTVTRPSFSIRIIFTFGRAIHSCSLPYPTKSVY